MTVTVNLNRSDIASILAEKYGVALSYVHVDAEQQLVGYGPNEHYECVPFAEVTIPKEKIKELDV